MGGKEQKYIKERLIQTGGCLGRMLRQDIEKYIGENSLPEP
jgi:hypothetical protein